MTNPQSSTERTGVLLLNFGGPETLTDIKPFLKNLFADPEIIRWPVTWLQRPMAWLLSTLREKKSIGYYRQIGGTSPQRRITQEQAECLREELAARGVEANVYIAMACWHPFVEETLADIERDGITRLVVIPLFPQYSVSTTGSVLKKLTRQFRERGGLPHLVRRYVTHFEDHPCYVAAVTDLILRELAAFPDKQPDATTVLFTAHSIPERYIDRGDPFLVHTLKTVDAGMLELTHRLGWTPPIRLAFQSKVGPVKWLEPSTEETLKQLAASGTKQVVAVPVSFVSEHIETLYEIDIQYRKLAAEVGITHFRRTPALNCHPGFIRMLADVTLERLPRPQGTVDWAELSRGLSLETLCRTILSDIAEPAFR